MVKPVSSAVIDGVKYEVKLNPKHAHSKHEHVVNFNKEASGAFRFFQFVERVARLVLTIFKDMSASMVNFFENLASKCGLAWAMLTLPRLPDVTHGAVKAVQNWSEPPKPGVSEQRDIWGKIQKISEGCAMWMYAVSLLATKAFGSVAKTVGDCFSLVSDKMDLSASLADWRKSKQCLEWVETHKTDDKAMRKMFENTVRYNFYRVVKAVCSVVSGVLGLMVLALGGPLIPGIVFIVMGLTSTIMATWASLHKNASKYELPDFEKLNLVASTKNTRLAGA
jgi:hypothetical protein